MHAGDYFEWFREMNCVDSQQTLNGYKTFGNRVESPICALLDYFIFVEALVIRTKGLTYWKELEGVNFS